ncbi:MAG: hypothetical protein HWE12_07410 [Oceanospirillaceae bacterium]|nr:hypothetical protein [Oceanospirillaceae bacterium]
MSDIKKLHKVIESLEEQSTRVSEFNGVLKAVNAAKAEISIAKDSFAALGDEQQKLVTLSYQKFDEFEKRLAMLDRALSAIESKMVAADQFESGRDRILLRLSELRFVSPEQFEHGITTSEKNTASLITENQGEVLRLIVAQQSAIKSLKTTLILGMMVLAGGIAFLAKDLVM